MNIEIFTSVPLPYENSHRAYNGHFCTQIGVNLAFLHFVLFRHMLRLHKGDFLLWWRFGLSGTHAYRGIFTLYVITRKI